MKFLGGVIYEGPSRLDGKPIVVIMTGFNSAQNRKTGKMLQTWILRADMNPMEALQTQSDASICGDCPHRQSTGGACYVTVNKAPLTIWRAWKRGRYVDWTKGVPTLYTKGRSIRIGAYGDPGAVPTAVWTRLLANEHDGHTGYTHQWRRRPSMRNFLMASVDSEAEHVEATRRGWRTFRVRSTNEANASREIDCPSERGVSCIDCGLCKGNPEADSKRAIVAAVKSISILVHGPLRFRRLKTVG